MKWTLISLYICRLLSIVPSYLNLRHPLLSSVELVSWVNVWNSQGTLFFPLIFLKFPGNSFLPSHPFSYVSYLGRKALSLPISSLFLVLEHKTLCLNISVPLITLNMPSRSLLADAFRAHPVHVHQKHIDFTSLQEIPDSHKWTQIDDEQHPLVDPLITESVPVIDLSDPNVLQNIGHACKTWGVLQVTNHGIPTSLLENIESASRSLFSLPIQQKLKAARSPDGVSGYGVARISSFFSKLMWSEGFTIVGSPLEHFRQLWSQDYTKFWYLLISHASEKITYIFHDFDT